MSFEDEDHSDEGGWLMPVRAGQAYNRSNGNSAEGNRRPPFGLLVFEENGTLGEKDITVLHSKWDADKIGVIVPGRKRAAVQWQAAHTYVTHEGQEMFICNICGRDLKLSGSVSAVTAHLTHRHPGIKERLEEMEQETFPRKKRGAPSEDKKRAGSRPSFETVKKPRTSIGKQERLIKKIKQIPQHVTTSKPVQLKRSKDPTELQRKAQVSQIVAFNFPLSHSESPWYQRLLETTASAARSGATAEEMEVTQKDIKETVFSATRKLRDHLKDRIKGRSLCCVTEHRQVQISPQTSIVYSTFRLQWIQDFKLASGVLAVHVSKKVGLELAHKEDCTVKLQEWDLPSKMLKFVVTDTPSLDTNAFGFDIQEKADEMEQIYCLDYLLNLVATRAFEGFFGVGTGDFIEAAEMCCEDDEDKKLLRQPNSEKNLLQKVSSLVRIFQDSIQANDELMTIAHQLSSSGEDEPQFLIQDDSNQSWWALQIMMERLLQLREAVTTYVSRQLSKSNSKITKRFRPPRLSEHDWEVLEELCIVMRPLRFAHQMLAGYSYITSPLVPLVVHLIYEELERVHLDDDGIGPRIPHIAGQMLDAMKEVFGDFCSRSYKNGENINGAKVHIHKSILYAHALDPRFKLLSVFPPSVQDQIWSGILEEMVSVTPTSVDIVLKQDSMGDVARTNRKSAGSAQLDSLFKLYSNNSQQAAIDKQPDQIQTQDLHRKCEIELKQFRESEGIEPKLDADVLREWWSEKSTQFPVLWRLAQRFFSISATSAPSSRAFSLSGNTAIHRGYQFGSDEMLRFLQENAAMLCSGDFLMP